MRTKSAESNKRSTRSTTRKPRAATRKPRSVAAAEVREELIPAPTMKIHFEHQTDPTRNWDGDVTGMRIVGNSIRGPQDREVAMYQAGIFRSNADRFKAIEIRCPVRVELQNEEGPVTLLGIFEGLRLVDGVLRASNDPRGCLARFDQSTRSWRLRQDQSIWSTLIFSPVDAG